MLYSLGLAPGFTYIMCISLRIIVNGVIGGSPFTIIKILGLSMKEVTTSFQFDFVSVIIPRRHARYTSHPYMIPEVIHPSYPTLHNVSMCIGLCCGFSIKMKHFVVCTHMHSTLWLVSQFYMLKKTWKAIRHDSWQLKLLEECTWSERHFPVPTARLWICLS